jgi:hypothetical protein
MRKTNGIAMALALLAVTGSYFYGDQISSSSPALAASSANHIWTLPPLTKEERVNGVREIIVPFTYKLYEGTVLKTPYSDEERQKCEAVHEQMKALTSDKILEPAHIVQSLNDEGIQPILNHCSALELDKDYRPSKEAWLDEKHVDHAFSSYDQATANMEFYDLSPFLGAGHWGYFAEGGRPHCKGTENVGCIRRVGFSGFTKIFNTNDCRSSMNLSYPLSRLRSNSRTVDGTLQVEYQPNQSVFAFVVLDKDVYQLGIRPDPAFQSSCTSESCKDAINNTFLYVNKIVDLSSQDTLACVFKGASS